MCGAACCSNVQGNVHFCNAINVNRDAFTLPCKKVVPRIGSAGKPNLSSFFSKIKKKMFMYKYTVKVLRLLKANFMVQMSRMLLYRRLQLCATNACTQKNHY